MEAGDIFQNLCNLLLSPYDNQFTQDSFKALKETVNFNSLPIDLEKEIEISEIVSEATQDPTEGICRGSRFHDFFSTIKHNSEHLISLKYRSSTNSSNKWHDTEIIDFSTAIWACFHYGAQCLRFTRPKLVTPMHWWKHSSG